MDDVLEMAVRQVDKLPVPSWNNISGDEWDRVGKALVRVMVEAQGHGLQKPLGPLQEAAFFASLSGDASKAVQTTALWLTDTRIVVESYGATKSPDLRAKLIARGMILEG